MVVSVKWRKSPHLRSCGHLCCLTGDSVLPRIPWQSLEIAWNLNPPWLQTNDGNLHFFFYMSRQVVNSFRFESSCVRIMLPSQYEGSHRQYLNKWAWHESRHSLLSETSTCPDFSPGIVFRSLFWSEISGWDILRSLHKELQGWVLSHTQLKASWDTNCGGVVCGRILRETQKPPLAAEC